MTMFSGIVFDKAEYEEMREYQKQQKRWVEKYGTLMFFDEWYELNQLAEAAIEHE